MYKPLAEGYISVEMFLVSIGDKSRPGISTNATGAEKYRSICTEKRQFTT